MAVIIMKLFTRLHFKQNTHKEGVNSIYYFVHLEPAKLICTVSAMWAIPLRSKRLMTIKLVLLGRQAIIHQPQTIKSGPNWSFHTKATERVFRDVAGNVAFQDIQFPPLPC